MSLWESDKGQPSFGLTMVYLPSVIAFVLMFSDSNSNLIDSPMPISKINPRIIRTKPKFDLDILVLDKENWILGFFSVNVGFGVR